jgi:hypothetical protein
MLGEPRFCHCHIKSNSNTRATQQLWQNMRKAWLRGLRTLIIVGDAAGMAFEQIDGDDHMRRSRAADAKRDVQRPG